MPLPQNSETNNPELESIVSSISSMMIELDQLTLTTLEELPKNSDKP